jgi:hypothetical protein
MVQDATAGCFLRNAIIASISWILLRKERNFLARAASCFMLWMIRLSPTPPLYTSSTWEHDEHHRAHGAHRSTN